MNEAETAELREHVKVYVLVFVTLAVLTVVTVGISYLDFSTPVAIVIAMVVASGKAFLVAGFFMHLMREEKVIIWLLLMCAAFLVSVVFGPLLTETGLGPLWPLSN